MLFDVSPSQFFVQVEDAELSPRLPQGTLAVADTAVEPNVNDLVVVSDEAAFHNALPSLARAAILRAPAVNTRSDHPEVCSDRNAGERCSGVVLTHSRLVVTIESLRSVI